MFFYIQISEIISKVSNESGVIKVEIPLNDDIDLKMVTGIEDGCNYQWIPGGKTLGGVTEGIIRQITRDQDSELFEKIIRLVNMEVWNRCICCIFRFKLSIKDGTK